MSWIEINCLSTPESALPLDNSNLQYLTAALSLYQIMHTCMQLPIPTPTYTYTYTYIYLYLYLHILIHILILLPIPTYIYLYLYLNTYALMYKVAYAGHAPARTPPRTDSYTNSAPTRLKKMRLRDGSPPSVQGTPIPCYKDGSKEKQETLAHSLFPCSLYVHSWSELSPPS